MRRPSPSGSGPFPVLTARLPIGKMFSIMKHERTALLGVLFCAAGSLIVLAGCSSTSSAPSTQVTVSGNFTVTSVNLSTTPLVGLETSTTYNSAAVGLAQGTYGSPGTTASYSIADVTTGSYELVVSLESTNASLAATYSINGGSTQSFSGTTGTGTTSPYSYNLTASSIGISANTTIDINIGP